MIESFRKFNSEILNAKRLIHDFLSNNQRNEDIFKAFNHLDCEIEEKIRLKLRDEHEDWFHGMDSKLTNKEDVMRRKAQDRIRGYLYKTKDELTKSSIYKRNPKAREIIDELIDDFFNFLSGVTFFGCLFDRSHEVRLTVDEIDAKPIEKSKRRKVDPEIKTRIEKSEILKDFEVALCDENGYFACHGLWNVKNCSYGHKMNPYASREALVLFSIYNLDHQIEISRSIFPSILKNVESLISEESECEIHHKKAEALSTLTYFREIFTVDNLKLVHIVCHDKTTHDDLKSKGKVLCRDCKEFKILRRLKF